MKLLRVLPLIVIPACVASAAGGYQYFDDTISISVNAVPLMFSETDNTGPGNLWRMPLDGGKLRFDVSASGVFDTYLTPLTMHSSGYVGISKHTPAATLHVGGGNPEIRFEYNGTDQYYGSLRWSGLQLGNNGANRIVAGRTAAGGFLEFFVNNTNEAAHYQQSPDGLLAMLISASGNVGIGTNAPQAKLDVRGSVIAATSDFANGATGSFLQIQQPVGAGDTYTEIGAFSNGGHAWNNLVLQRAGGNVGIGTTNPQNKLDVNGTIRGKEVIVESDWADYVFQKDYALPSLGEVGEHIRVHGRLPGVPSAEEVAARGVSIGESQRVLLEKVEELTLYMLQQQREIESLKRQISRLTEAPLTGDN